MSNAGNPRSADVLTALGSGKSALFMSPYGFISASGTFSAISGQNYLLTAASTITLPSSPSNGNTIAFVCDTASNVVLTASAGQVINIQNVISNYAGTATSATQGNGIMLVYNSNATAWDALKVTGTWTLNTFLPSSVANGLIWVDGADPLGTGTPPSNGANVLPVDKLGICSLTQGTTSRRPVFNTNVQNSLGAISSNFANVTFVTVGSSPTFLSGMSFYSLFTPSTQAQAYCFGCNGTSNIPAFITAYAGVSYEWFNNTDRYTFSAGATGLNLIEALQTDATTLLGYLNGSQVFSHVPGVAVAGRKITGLFGAASGNSTLTLAELIIYNRVLTTAQQLNVRRYIAQKWAVSIAS